MPRQSTLTLYSYDTTELYRAQADHRDPESSDRQHFWVIYTAINGVLKLAFSEVSTLVIRNIIQKEISRDLDILMEDERTLDIWLKAFGSVDEFKEKKKYLLSLVEGE